MANKYFFKPEKKVWKQGFLMENENGKVIYEAKVLKQSILGSQTVEFINHITGKSDQHKIGAVVTGQGITGGMLDAFSKRSYFKYDGKRIFDYLHELGIRIENGFAGGKLGMKYTISLKGKEIATSSMTSPNGGKSIIAGAYWYDVYTEEENLDLVFLTTYAIARTEQTFYN